MISNANILLAHNPNPLLSFKGGNIIHLDTNSDLEKSYDVIFTDRCIININSLEQQLKALDQLINKLKSGGYLILIENPTNNYENQNVCREVVGLERRTPADYNLFLDEKAFLEHAKKKVELIEIEDFGSLHDIVLYVLVPMINGGKIDYEHPIVNATADFLTHTSPKFKNAFGRFGQNRLYLFKKR